MNPQEQHEAPSFELPSAQPPEQASPLMPEHQGADTTETQHAIALEQGVSSPQLPSVAPPFVDPQASPLQAPVLDPVTQPPQASTSGAPHIADDTDLIEKEWVIKAKEIVAKTSHDPHLQNREMNKFKADYLKKRYNKDIKLSEDT